MVLNSEIKVLCLDHPEYKLRRPVFCPDKYLISPTDLPNQHTFNFFTCLSSCADYDECRSASFNYAGKCLLRTKPCSIDEEINVELGAITIYKYGFISNFIVNKTTFQSSTADNFIGNYANDGLVENTNFLSGRLCSATMKQTVTFKIVNL